MIACACSGLSAGVAQLVEHLICNQGVAGSSPAAGTNKINDLGDFDARGQTAVSPGCHQPTGRGGLNDKNEYSAGLLNDKNEYSIWEGEGCPDRRCLTVPPGPGRRCGGGLVPRRFHIHNLVVVTTAQTEAPRAQHPALRRRLKPPAAPCTGPLRLVLQRRIATMCGRHATLEDRGLLRGQLASWTELGHECLAKAATFSAAHSRRRSILRRLATAGTLRSRTIAISGCVPRGQRTPYGGVASRRRRSSSAVHRRRMVPGGPGSPDTCHRRWCIRQRPKAWAFLTQPLTQHGRAGRW